jgi:hypothetical protein
VGALLITVALGVLSRAVDTGWTAGHDALGGACYAAAVYLALVIVSTLLRRSWSAPMVGGLTVGLCWAIEAFQSTGWTERTVQSAGLRTVLGTTFGFTDLLWYVVGAVVVALVDVRWLRPEVANPIDTSAHRSDW